MFLSIVVVDLLLFECHQNVRIAVGLELAKEVAGACSKRRTMLGFLGAVSPIAPAMERHVRFRPC